MVTLSKRILAGMGGFIFLLILFSFTLPAYAQEPFKSLLFYVSGDGPGGDLGYPSTVELADGTLLSVWYEVIKGSPHAVLRQAHWKLEI